MSTPRRLMRLHCSSITEQAHLLTSCKKFLTWIILVAFMFVAQPSSVSFAKPISTHELHIIFDTTQEHNQSATIDLNSLRLISGLLPPSVSINLWEYKGHLTPIKPSFTISRDRKKSTKSFPSGFDKAELLESITKLTETFQHSKLKRDILLITANGKNDTKLLSPNVERLASQLKVTDTRFSSLLLKSQKQSPIYRLFSSITSGWNKTIEHTGPYAYEYLNYLERFASLNYIPLHETLMKIDDNISDATLVLFKNIQETNDIEIIPPFEDPFTLLDIPNYVRWIQTPAYDMINIQNPKAGTWQIFSDNSNHQRIVIDTNLIINTTSFDSLIPARSYQELNIELKEDSQPILSPKILDHVAVKVSQIKDGLDQYAWFPSDNGKNGDIVGNDGLFSIPLQETLKHGEYLFRIDVDGKKFQRLLHRHINVEENLAWVHSEYLKNSNEHVISIIPFTQFLKPESIIMNATIHDQNGATHEKEISRYNEYSWTLTTKHARNIEINIAGTSPSGKTSSVWLPPITLEHQEPAKPHMAMHASDIEKPNELKSTQETHSKQPHKHTTSDQPTLILISETSTLSISITLLLANLLVLAIGFIGHKYWRKHNETWQTHLEGRLRYE